MEAKKSRRFGILIDWICKYRQLFGSYFEEYPAKVLVLIWRNFHWLYLLLNQRIRDDEFPENWFSPGTGNPIL